VLLVIVIAWYFIQRIATPLQDLHQTLSRKLEDEDYSPIPLSGPDEIESTQRAINQTFDKLRHQK
jgi:methyl-accepting chemotaxis protein